MVLAGERVLASDFDPPAATRCRAYSSAGVSATVNNTLTLVPFGAESYDTASMHSTSSNTSRIIVPVAGNYHIIAQCGWAFNATGRRTITVRKNAAGVSGGGTQVMINTLNGSANSGTQFQVTDDLELLANDYLEMFALQQSTVTLDVASGETNTFMVVRLNDPA